MALREEVKQFQKNINKDIRQLYGKVKQYPLISLLFIIIIVLVITLPYLQVSYQGISNNTEKATLENQYRTTFAQILGGVAIGIGLYYTWRRITIAEEDLKTTQENLKVAQENLKVSQEGQITERFTRAIDQLGSPSMETRLGGIYALERLSNESDKDYWPIMEILAAYIRQNSSIQICESNKITHISMDIEANESGKNVDSAVRNIPCDIQAVLTVIGRRKYSHDNGELSYFDLHETYLRGANLDEANFVNAYLEKVNLESAQLHEANFQAAYLKGANFKHSILQRANLNGALLICAHFEWALLIGADLEKAHLIMANLENAFLIQANLREADLEKANLRETSFLEANLTGANLKGARNLSIDQLSKAKTLYNAKIDDELLIPLKEKCPALFEVPYK